MAKLHIVESNGVQPIDGVAGAPQALKMPPLATDDVDFTSGSTASSAFNADTVLVQLESDTDCRLAWGTNPTAQADSGQVLKANRMVVYAVPKGVGLKVAAITKA